MAFEGMDGAGKSTAARNVKQKLEEMGLEVVLTREPGGSLLAEQIRTILLDPANTMLTPEAEALLYAASRAQHLKETILPALKEGKIVLCDRFLDSSLVYQGIARGLGVKEIEAVNDFALHGFRPEMTLFLMLDPSEGIQRIGKRGNENRLDLEKNTFHQKVADGFMELLQSRPDAFTVIDASQTPEKVTEDILKNIMERLREASDS